MSAVFEEHTSQLKPNYILESAEEWSQHYGDDVATSVRQWDVADVRRWVENHDPDPEFVARIEEAYAQWEAAVGRAMVEEFVRNHEHVTGGRG